jgi:4-hydroxythreonine-4-phosphate dehydrogenase
VTDRSIRYLITMGDVAGIGPEIIAKGWHDLVQLGEPVVIGDPVWLDKSISDSKLPLHVQPINKLEDARPTSNQIPCLNPSKSDLSQVQIGHVSAEAGKAAADFLIHAIDLTMSRQADAIVTSPLHKEGLHAAGLSYPGHTEILAERTGSPSHAMVLYGDQLAVAHATLHTALKKTFSELGIEVVLAKIRLMKHLLERLGHPIKIACGSVNPHASDGGLFGDEEARIITPAIAQARTEGIDVIGPIPNDAIFQKADRGEFFGIVAMYHDAGHIAMKYRSGMRCVNITVGLPIIRTSVAHGTAYDIAGKNLASPASLLAAAHVAVQLAKTGQGI